MRVYTNAEISLWDTSPRVYRFILFFFLPLLAPPPPLFLRAYARCILAYLRQGGIVNSCSRVKFVRKTLDAASYDDLLDPVRPASV